MCTLRICAINKNSFDKNECATFILFISHNFLFCLPCHWCVPIFYMGAWKTRLFLPSGWKMYILCCVHSFLLFCLPPIVALSSNWQLIIESVDQSCFIWLASSDLANCKRRTYFCSLIILEFRTELGNWGASVVSSNWCIILIQLDSIVHRYQRGDPLS